MRALSTIPGSRKLRIEPLEERRVLDAAVASDEFPWHNGNYRLDVNNDGVTTVRDLAALINKINADDVGNLPVPPPVPVVNYYDTSGDNKLTATDVVRVINGLLMEPTVEVTSLTPFTIDVTPHVTVKVTAPSPTTVANGTVVTLDIDRNNDGDFTDPGELGHTQSTIYNGESTIQITPALPRTGEQYNVRIRARLMNNEAVEGVSAPMPLVVDTATSTALADYVNAPDFTYGWQIRRELPVSIPQRGSFTYYAIEMTSQTWRSAADVNLPVWRHWVEVYVPSGNISNTATLLIDGGSNQNFDEVPMPIETLAVAAISLGSVFVNLKVVPNEPVIFTDETRTRTEDAIIAYSFDKFMENIGEPGNETWPLLVAMTKSAVKAMDTIQALIPQERPGTVITDFLVTGYSKRGWTTWLTAAVDDRVRGIIPGVFDNLNQGEQMVHHYGVYGFFAEAVGDYNEMQIFDRIISPEGQKLSAITDPYRYLANGRFDDMPKLIINSAGDEFFVSDSAQFYWDDIPGEDNYLLYIPNSGHGLDYEKLLDSQVLLSTVTFADAILNNRTLPKYSWEVQQDGGIRVETDTTPLSVKLWWTDNPTSRDFRDFNHRLVWQSQELSPIALNTYLGDVGMPATGARAYMVQVTFPNNVVSTNELLTSPYVFTTEVRVKSPLAWHDWPFETAFAPLAAESAAAPAATPQAAASDPQRSAVAVGIVLAQEPKAGEQQVVPFVSPPASPLPAAAIAFEQPDEMWNSEEPQWNESDATEDAIDEIVESVWDELIA